MSQTARHIEKEVAGALKRNYPGMTHYMADKWDTLAQQKLEGGAPNNFILMQNDRLYAPFNSSVGRFSNAAMNKFF